MLPSPLTSLFVHVVVPPRLVIPTRDPGVREVSPRRRRGARIVASAISFWLSSTVSTTALGAAVVAATLDLVYDFLCDFTEDTVHDGGRMY